ncbi:endopeptidase La [Candidatus Roizmanbacteria bacterium RIFOXYB2_FULL_41_10]|uniref:Lon protease n=1 Tax=Candidatus Roizmanbacteria bacterium RIFOXYA1_FULL_41_12 TaxID=1802082 RepID=A0A1F7KA80_9BACT|nr:MAG: endopeptidase La [Candidatus Roizmanbacteria bacterium RIFOXYA1_FULL_41_12]OGK67581.1 MAG: endopeptidase La [Candidatus Roizmanbacteria bacterium RIFOXYB1_FULL_41_27]OGK70986.1 MAG: endopeptidase La [Candidatus Roizmanbacteria bacterium RIFOXYB2_FULL_41_10]OGK71161.1 MAG: endopeptidase La [Candidatus Roizmanbacteria bacterium RIFOXYC1_FULL_41_16]OGK74624.1 MAG: endopeptidase La [Candidatus Roizmanbacteria bacterium RIFOXYD1_FULL_41_24]
MSILLPKTDNKQLPVVPIRDGLIYPSSEAPLIFGRPKTVRAFDAALKNQKELILVLQKDSRLNDPLPSDLYDTGVVIKIERYAALEHGELQVLVKGLTKVKIVKYVVQDPFLIGEYQVVQDDQSVDDETMAMVKHLNAQLKKAINLGKNIDFISLMNVFSDLGALEFSYQVASVLDIKPNFKQALLEETSLKNRLKTEIEYLIKELKVLEIEKKISAKTQAQFEKGMRENVLREKMKTIEKELGGTDEDKETALYRKKIKEAKMPKEVEKKALKELERLIKMSQYNPETSYLRTYLDWLTDLPWSVSTANNIDIAQAEKILDQDHFGLKKIKERILEFLAVMKLRKHNYKNNKSNMPPTILCFVGPPGVGKTSLGKSIARALGRKFIKMSLGGIRDEAEIRGHRRTYVGALPGRIIQGIKQAEANNPVFMLDEIDKIGRDFRGDPSSALLEALDPEQNSAFSDHYLEVSYDLSKVMFITTANVLDTIPPALLDRLEVIHFPGYTQDEKQAIAKNYLVQKQLMAHGLDSYNLTVKDKTIKLIISRYTREAGVRELERQIATLFRKVARKIAETLDKKKGLKTLPLSLEEKDAIKYLGPYKYSSMMAEKKDEIGMSTGLAWTQAGGEILFIEVSTMPGKGILTLTGHLGEVMKESCQAALTYVRSRYQKFGLEKKLFETIDIHVHVPEGAVPKDGPSAGVAITTALISALTKRSAKKDVAMTGEVTLRGRALEIGGVKEKVIAAHSAGIKTIILPKDNKKDLIELPQKTVKDLQFKFVSHMDEVVEIALNKKK